METMESKASQQTYTGISDIIMQGRMQLVNKKSIALSALLTKKCSREELIAKANYISKWKEFIRNLEIWFVKAQLKRLSNEVENLKFQE